MLGGFLGAAIVYFFYQAKFKQFDPNLEHTAGIFSTFPAITNTFMPGFLAEIIASAILMFAILAIPHAQILLLNLLKLGFEGFNFL